LSFKKMLVALRLDAVMSVLMSMEGEVEVEVEATIDARSREERGCGLGRIKRNCVARDQ
jgi:hypothetical protein